MVLKKNTHSKFFSFGSTRFIPLRLLIALVVFIAFGLAWNFSQIATAKENKPSDSPQEVGGWDHVRSDTVIPPHILKDLSPLYPTTVRSLKQMIETQASVELLPRSIKHIEITKSGLPCFQMHCGNMYSFNYSGIRWTAAQEHGGSFKLFYDAIPVATNYDARQFIIRSAFSFREMFDGQYWHKFSPISGGIPRRTKMAYGPEGLPYFIMEGRIYRLRKDRWTPQKVGTMQTQWREIMSNENGQLFAISTPDKNGKILHAFHSGQEWICHEVLSSIASNASYHLCQNGMVVVNSKQQIHFFDQKHLAPFDWTIQFPEKYQATMVVEQQNCVYSVGISHANDSSSALNVIKLTFENGSFTTKQFALAIKGVDSLGKAEERTNASTSVALHARSQNSRRRDPKKNDLTLLARPKGGIVVQIKEVGVFLVDDSEAGPDALADFNGDVKKMVKLELPEVIYDHGQMIGCDIHDMVYFSLPPEKGPSNDSSRNQKFIACALSAKKKVPFENLVDSGELFAVSEPNQFAMTPEGCLFIAIEEKKSLDTSRRFQTNRSLAARSSRPPRSSRFSKAPSSFPTSNQRTMVGGRLLAWDRSEEKPYLVDDRLIHVAELVPCRNGATLAICCDGRCALIQHGEIIAHERTIGDLLTKHFQQMLELAPTNPCDTRYNIRVALPLMSTGKTLWFNDLQDKLYRIASADGPAELIEHPVSTELIGRLQDGTLLVRPAVDSGRRSHSDLREWCWIDEPDKLEDEGIPFLPVLRKLKSPPKNLGCGLLERPQDFTGGWLTSNHGTIYLTQGFDRTYFISQCDQWKMQPKFGAPLLQDTKGRIWAYRSSRVYHGYQVIDEEQGERYTSIPTHLAPVTPVEQIGDQMLCTTPLGLAVFQCDPKKIDANESALRYQNIAEPCEYLGRVDNTVFLRTSDNRLAKIKSNLCEK